MHGGNHTVGNPRPVCTICIEDLKPIAEDLQSIPACGHVFHELCIQQWMEYCPRGKKPTCPVCKQSCSKDGLTRLYFPSTGDSTQFVNCGKDGGLDGNVGVEELEKEVRRLEGKVSVLNVSFEGQKDSIKKLTDELSSWKEIVKMEEARYRELKKEKERIEQYLNMKTEELFRKSTECTKLQEKSLGLAKELAALKLATDLNLKEEEMVKLASVASLGHGNNPGNVIDVLKKSLYLRNKSYKELMSQCNSLGRSGTHAQKKLDKSKEKIMKLNTRLQELEKALEGKENEVLRNLKTSYKEKENSNQTSLSVDHLKRNANNSEVQNASTSMASVENEGVTDLKSDYCFMEEDVNEHRECPFTNVKSSGNNDSERIVARKVTHIASSTWKAETLIIDDISKQTPSIAVKQELPAYDSAGCSGGGLFGTEGANRTIGKWCKSPLLTMSASNGGLISVGSDGRGGRVKVLRDHDQILDEKTSRLFPKKHKHGSKQSGQFHIENFFSKAKS